MAFGVPSGGKQGNISFSLSNNLEMKYKDKNDSIRKVSLIDELGASISYNMAAQTRPWSDLNLNLRLKERPYLVWLHLPRCYESTRTQAIGTTNATAFRPVSDTPPSILNTKPSRAVRQGRRQIERGQEDTRRGMGERRPTRPSRRRTCRAVDIRLSNPFRHLSTASTSRRTLRTINKKTCAILQGQSNSLKSRKRETDQQVRTFQFGLRLQ